MKSENYVHFIQRSGIFWTFHAHTSGNCWALAAFERMKNLPIEVSEKMSADEKMSLRKMILEMDGTSIALPGLGFVTVLFLILNSEANS